MGDDLVYLKRDNDPDEWVDGSEACLGRHHLYVPTKPSSFLTVGPLLTTGDIEYDFDDDFDFLPQGRYAIVRLPDGS